MIVQTNSHTRTKQIHSIKESHIVNKIMIDFGTINQPKSQSICTGLNHMAL
jgi:hypothetical protein